MEKTNNDKIWIAVRVQRGFISEVKAFSDEGAARKKEFLWRRNTNPDYDEIAVSHVHVSKATENIRKGGL